MAESHVLEWSAGEKSAPPAGAAEPHLRIRGLKHQFDGTVALAGIDLDVARGEFLAILGDSGSGKTTLLRVIAGLIQPQAGSIVIAGTDVTRLPSEKRDVGLVFQNYALFPHLDVSGNIEFPLKSRGVGKAERREKVKGALNLVGLSDYGNRLPSQLSGGQQQRVAVARAIVYEPDVLLMDEPLGALDRSLRRRLGSELRDLQRKTGITAIYVTHDADEAFSLATRVGIMRLGELIQVDVPVNVYLRPADLRVGQLVGDMNVISATVIGRNGDRAVARADEFERLDILIDLPLQLGDRRLIGIRPEKIRVSLEAPDGPFAAPGTIRTVVFYSGRQRATVVLNDHLTLLAELSPDTPVEEGATCAVSLMADPAMVFKTT